MKMLKVENLSFAYDGEMVIKDINFEYDSEDFLTLVGPNGSGKSTLLKLILGLLKPLSGKVELLCTHTGYVPQDTTVNKEFPITVLDTVLMGRLGKSGFGFYSRKDRQSALDALAEVQMSEFADKKTGSLSGGQRQRVFIARALACEAKLLILDEPTASVDMQGQIQIYDLLKSLNRSKGVIVVSHDINVALGYATKIAYLSDTLFMHEPSSLTKETFLKTLQTNSVHNCPVDVLIANTCTHHHKGHL
ncbi:MAG: ABC transporter ATP-binding protein [Campylobacteraceae bacterium]|jgi:zinc transport system ATP-binding protein|nr:ABC transporter ATP-binding protein [Campylobacteraceae bacterium]